MKITQVEAIYLRQAEVKKQCDSGQDALIVRISTDAGITGLGEVDSAPLAVKGAIEGPYSHAITSGLRELILGEDPFETEYLWDKMYHQNVYAGRRGIAIHAMSGIDMALWDIKGKALGQPIWKLLGGGFYRNGIRAYASSLFGPTPAETGLRARRFRDLGFSAVKFGWAPMGQDEKTDIALVREARSGLGDDPDLMIDAGLVWDAETGLRARAFSEQRIFWLEEPLRADDYEGYRKLSQATEVRIAAGEEESERRSYLELMDRGQIDVVQVDLTRCGGFTEAMKIASLAQDRGLPVVNHGFTTYINVAAALHFVNAIPNSFITEFVVQEGTTLRDRLTRQRIVAKDGIVPIPMEPGLGIDLNPDALEKFAAVV